MFKVVASRLDTCLNVEFGIWMYILKQSLVHLPSCCMSQRGNPAEAAVDAAPIRREGVDTGAAKEEGMALFSRQLTRRRVSSVLSE